MPISSGFWNGDKLGPKFLHQVLLESVCKVKLSTRFLGPASYLFDIRDRLSVRVCELLANCYFVRGLVKLLYSSLVHWRARPIEPTSQ
jgi:hypothetical protein